ncbi:MAG TPA: neutral zinc metallopeptidase [Thermomicrobiales bacterium]|jgi:predicted metalloprotease|nr:neutral zinc metallopeptidase [Thermomicrobiales bacterium]
MSRGIRSLRSVYLTIIAMLILGLVPVAAAQEPVDHATAQGFVGHPAQMAQDAPVEPEVSQDSYVSPLGFELEWESDEWELTNSLATFGLEVALFEPDNDVLVQVWGFMNFGGDPAECLDQMEGFYPEFFEIEELEEVEGLIDDPVGESDDLEYATYEYTETPRDDEASNLYIGCQTLAEGESVNVFVVSAGVDDFEEQVEAADTFITDGFIADPVDLDYDALTARVDVLATDIDRFYARSLRLEQAEYSAPDYRSFDEPTESSCLSSNIDGTVDRRNPVRYPGLGPAYCGTDNVVLVDIPWMAVYIVPQGGDILLATILAHESGHHLQEISGWNAGYDQDDPKDTFISEQQADCLAGAYMRSTVLRGIYTQRDVEAAIQLFFDIGGFEEGVDHGTGEEREEALMLGFDEGFDVCGIYD